MSDQKLYDDAVNLHQEPAQPVKKLDMPNK